MRANRSTARATPLWTVVSRFGSDRDDVRREVGVRLAAGWSLDDIEHSVRAIE
jgi:hypothetical protein